MRNVIEIRSVNGNFFRIGRNSDGYYLKNLSEMMETWFSYSS